MRIFPIAARTEQRVRITYYQELNFEHDSATYVYPLATDSRQDVDSRTRGRFALTLDVKSEVPITAMESPSHKDGFVMVQRWQIQRRNALRIERDRRAQERVRDELNRIRDKTLAGLGPEAVEQRTSVNPVPAAASLAASRKQRT